jgi:MFS family permease
VKLPGDGPRDSAYGTTPQGLRSDPVRLALTRCDAATPSSPAPEVLLSSEPHSTRLPRGLGPLQYRNFALYWLGLAVSNTGRWAELTGAVWLMYELTESAFLLGLLGLSRSLPAIVLSPIAGVVADRMDQRRLLIITQLAGLATSVSLVILVMTAHIAPWQICVQVAVQASIASFDSACRQALFPRLAPRAYLAEAVTLSHTAMRLSALAGPAIAGYAIVGLGVASPFVLNTGTYVPLVTAILLMRGIVPRTVAPESSMRTELRDGWRYIRASPVLISLLKLELIFGVLQMNPVMITIFGREVLGVGPERLGWLIAAPAVGSIASVVILITMGQARRQGRAILTAQMFYAVILVLMSFTSFYAAAFAALAAIGLLDSYASVTRASVAQMSVPGRMRGRIMANFGMVTRGTAPLAQAQSGLTAAILGTPLTLLAAGLTLGAAAVAIARLDPTLWRFVRSDGGRQATDTPVEPPPPPS